MLSTYQQRIDRQSRRHFLQVASSVAGATLLSACIKASSPVERRDEVEPTTEKKTVIFWGDAQHPLDLAAEGFKAAYPAIEWQSPHPPDQVKKMKTALATGTGLPDLYWTEAPLAQAWGCQALLTDLTTHLEPELANYHPAKLAETFAFKHKMHMGWPGDLGVSGWYYRYDKLQALGWQETELAALSWPAFIELTAELRAQELYSYCFPATGWSPLFFLLLHQLGGTAISQNGERITLSDEKGIYAMRLVKQLWEAGGGLEVEWGQPSYWRALAEGKLLGDFAAAWMRSAWEANLQDAAEAQAPGNWRIAPLPGGDDIVHRTGIWGGGQLVMPKAASNPDSALLFMQYALASVDGATRYGASTVIPAYRPYLTSTSCSAQRSPLFGDWPFCQFWAKQEQELSPTYFRPAGWDAVNAAVQQEIMSIVLDTYSIEDGMSRIVEQALPAFNQTRCL